MIFEQIATGGCQSYLVGCADTCVAALIDPELEPGRPLPRARRARRAAHPLPDRHAHPRRSLLRHARARAAARRAGGDAPREPAPFVDLRRRRRRDAHRRASCGSACCTRPGTPPTRCAWSAEDRVFTGDTLLHRRHRAHRPADRRPERRSTTASSSALLQLDPALQVFPAHDYKGRGHTTIAQELAENPRLQKRERAAFVDDDAQPQPRRCRRTSPRRCAPT